MISWSDPEVAIRGLQNLQGGSGRCQEVPGMLCDSRILENKFIDCIDSTYCNIYTFVNFHRVCVFGATVLGGLEMYFLTSHTTPVTVGCMVSTWEAYGSNFWVLLWHPGAQPSASYWIDFGYLEVLQGDESCHNLPSGCSKGHPTVHWEHWELHCLAIMIEPGSFSFLLHFLRSSHQASKHVKRITFRVFIFRRMELRKLVSRCNAWESQCLLPWLPISGEGWRELWRDAKA